MCLGMKFDKTFILLYVLTGVSYSFAHASTCQNIGEHVLMCNNYIPIDLPKGTETVDIIDIVPIQTHIDAKSFQGQGWSLVKRLHLATVERKGMVINVPWIRLNNYTFRNLYALEYLRLFLPALIHVEGDTFKGLGNLTELDLYGCKRTSLYYLIQVLKSTESMPHLKILRIDYLNTMGRPPIIATSFNKEFVQSLALRNITELYARHQFIDILNFEALSAICDVIQVFDISFSFISRQMFPTPVTCKSLRTLDITGTRTPTSGSLWYLNMTNFFYRGKLYDKLYYYRNVEKLNADSVFLHVSRAKNSLLIIDSLEFQLKEISLQNNMLHYLDITIETDALKHLEKLELQGNNMQYIKGDTFGFARNLKMLNMSNNKIGVMQRYNSTDFEKLFHRLHDLEVLDLSSNGLTYIPWNTFSINPKLEAIYLANNEIAQLALNSSFTLSLVDLRNNTITHLNEISRHWFDINFAYNTNDTLHKFYANVSGNPFLCECEDQDFLQWFVQSPLLRNSTHKITCSSSENKQITQQLIDNLKEMCERPFRLRRIIIASSLTSVSVTITTIAVVMALRYRRRKLKKKRTIKEIIAQIQDGAYHVEFPVFLSYNNNDADFVMEHIYPTLSEHLRQIMDVQRDIVCIGDRHFRPGRGIYDEILRCLENSAVVLTVVSSEFCQSAYCRNEFEQAYAMEKPILLLFKEEVEEEEMTPLIKEMFKKYARITMRVVNEEVHIAPGWDVICKSILEMLPR